MSIDAIDIGCDVDSSLFDNQNLPNHHKMDVLKIASYLTEPICKVREYYYSLNTLSTTCEDGMQKVAYAAYFILGIGVFALLAPITALCGIALRGLVAAFEANPFVYQKGASRGKSLPQDRTITVVSHNSCYTPAGYAMTDGGVTPSSDSVRMNRNTCQAKQLRPDIIALYEVTDVCDAGYISSKLPDYPFVIPVAGVRAIGPSSMLYIASKYEIVEDSIQFTPFLKGIEVTGRAAYSEKGFLSFDIDHHSADAPPVHIVSTHLQHSEIPARPQQDEELDEPAARAAQMHKIALHIEKKVAQGYAVIFVGDLNQEESEIDAFFSEHDIHWLRDETIRGRPTWGGDAWCAALMGKPSSGPLVLDYAFAAGKAAEIRTEIIGTGYDSNEFRQEAGSDHDVLCSRIVLAV